MPPALSGGHLPKVSLAAAFFIRVQGQQRTLISMTLAEFHRYALYSQAPEELIQEISRVKNRNAHSLQQKNGRYLPLLPDEYNKEGKQLFLLSSFVNRRTGPSTGQLFRDLRQKKSRPDQKKIRAAYCDEKRTSYLKCPTLP